MPQGGVHIRWPDQALDQEARLFHYKWYAALAYIRANRLNHNVIEGKNDRFGLIASGKAFNDTRQALQELGLDDATCQRLGIRLHKVAVVWPLEAQLTREFASGLQEVLVVEEKRQVIEYQIKEELYNWRADLRPRVLGKFNEGDGDFCGGEWSEPNPTANTLLRANADLSPALIARAIAKRLKKLGIDALGFVKTPDARPDARLRAKGRPAQKLARVSLHPHRLTTVATAFSDRRFKNPGVFAHQGSLFAFA
jgi:indolepyruvate ferredoxin oxidoreductase